MTPTNQAYQQTPPSIARKMSHREAPNAAALVNSIKKINRDRITPPNQVVVTEEAAPNDDRN